CHHPAQSPRGRGRPPRPGDRPLAQSRDRRSPARLPRFLPSPGAGPRTGSPGIRIRCNWFRPPRPARARSRPLARRTAQECRGSRPNGTRAPRAPRAPAPDHRIRLLRRFLRVEAEPPRVAIVCAALNRAKARYLVIGGIACILHGYARATDDIDILIERTEAN